MTATQCFASLPAPDVISHGSPGSLTQHPSIG
jgi:hypothetical protein